MTFRRKLHCKNRTSQFSHSVVDHFVNCVYWIHWIFFSCEVFLSSPIVFLIFRWISVNRFRKLVSECHADLNHLLSFLCTEEDCRRRWKSLRDMFIKDKRAEQRRRASGTSHRSWKYSWQMSFLTPFIQSRSLAADEHEEDRDDEDKEEERTTDGNSSFVLQDFEGDHGMLDGSSHYTASGSQGPGRKRKWPMEGTEDLEDEMFLFSLLPYLRRLPYAKKSAVKLKIHQLLYEAEFK